MKKVLLTVILVFFALGYFGCDESSEIYFSVKRDTPYDWNGNAVVRRIDFSSDSTIISNVGNGFNAAESTFTAPVSGTYTFHGVIDFQNVVPGDLVYAFISRHGSGYNYEGPWIYATGTLQMVTVNITVHLDAGQGVSLNGYVNATNPPGEVYGNSSNYAFTYFMGARVF